MVRLFPKNAAHLGTRKERAYFRKRIGYHPGVDGKAGTWDSFDAPFLHSDNSATFNPKTCFHHRALMTVRSELLLFHN